jgi:hypothetical protein
MLIPVWMSLLLLSACPADDAAEGEGDVGEGEGDVGEGEGDVGEGEGDVGEGEGEGEGEGDVGEGEGEPGWRSELFPTTWTPADTADDGRFLHDFSYAGAGNGDAEPLAPEPIIDVLVEPGVNATTSIQQAIDAASVAGGTVQLPAGDIRVDGQLIITASNVWLRGAGVDTTRVQFTSTGLAYDAHIRIGAVPLYEDDVALAADADARDTSVRITDATGFAVGSDIVIGHVISEAFVAAHGMTNVWGPFNNSWQVFARRRVTAVDTTTTPHTVHIDVPLRAPALLRDGASVRRPSSMLSNVGVANMSIHNVVGEAEARSIDNQHAIKFSGVQDAWMVGVHSYALDGTLHLQSGGVLVEHSVRMTMDDVAFGRSQNRDVGGNGYLFEISQSNEILIRNSMGENGRHNFIQNWGFGTSGCVLRNIVSRGGVAVSVVAGFDIELPASSEFHHSLATANLVEDSIIEDGFIGANRGTESSGAGHSATQNVFWNVRGNGRGTLRSLQYGHGYIIGTDQMRITTDVGFVSPGTSGRGTEPPDHVEGEDQAATLVPQQLSVDQRARRLAP